MNATQYLNVDLELESLADLSPLAEHFGDRVMVLFSQRVGEFYQMALETAVAEEPHQAGALDADACIQDFLALLVGLPSPLRALWISCRARTFDIGLAAGATPPAFTQVLSTATLGAAAAEGVAVRFTIYAHTGTPTPALERTPTGVHPGSDGDTHTRQ